jgi:hypothetical protein
LFIYLSLFYSQLEIKVYILPVVTFLKILREMMEVSTKRAIFVDITTKMPSASTKTTHFVDRPAR